MTTNKIICRDINQKEYEMPASDLFFRPGVYGVIIKDNNILLVKQNGNYDFPGGGIEINETIEEALIREFKEETGYDIKPIRVITCFTNFFKSLKHGTCSNSIMIYFICDIAGGKILDEHPINDKGNIIEKAEWVNLGNIDKINFSNSSETGKNEEIIKTAIKLSELT